MFLSMIIVLVILLAIILQLKSFSIYNNKWIYGFKISKIISLSISPSLSLSTFLESRKYVTRSSTSTILRSSKVENSDDISVNVKDMPDAVRFKQFYENVVFNGKEMTKKQFIKYDIVDDLLSDGLVYKDDLDSLWISAVGDAEGLNQNEAYEMLCMVLDIPDPEDVEFLNREFNELKDKDGLLSFFKFASWQDVQDILNEKVLTSEEITDIWRLVAGDLNSKISRKLFGKLNLFLDDKIETKNDEFDVDDDDESNVSIWSKDFDPKTVFDGDSLVEITNFFSSNVDSDGNISYVKFLAWPDIQELLNDKSLSITQLKMVWDEASSGRNVINYDIFLRLNVNLDLLIDELEIKSTKGNKNMINKIEEVDAEAFYRREFSRITNKGTLMRLDMLLEWEDINELVVDGSVTEKQIIKMFEGLPKEPMGIPPTGFGITQDTFVAFNGMLDIVLDATGAIPVNESDRQKSSAPIALTSELERPMPKEVELKLGSLSSPLELDNNSVGLSEEELEMMQSLDKADNMLNSGSFGDFDQLIGDVNDPRLQALRECTDENSLKIKGKLNDVVGELATLCKIQSRCGLDKPSEEVETKIRNLIAAVIEKGDKLSTRDINVIRNAVNGKWRLLYTNSEMFDFYNGVTGLANVFPATKFNDLILQYSSDGFLSEAKYYEKLTTPVGSIDATVHANWDLMKEMSFMTNDNSVVLRSYCTKVTAGPIEYEAQENWKSLRTLSMNEVVYVDDNIQIMRNCGALRIFFVFEKIS